MRASFGGSHCLLVQLVDRGSYDSSATGDGGGHGAVVVAVEVSAEVEDVLLLVEEVAIELSPDGAGAVDVGALRGAADVGPDVVGMVDEVLEVGCELACEAAVCAGVDVEETNGGAF